MSSSDINVNDLDYLGDDLSFLDEQETEETAEPSPFYAGQRGTLGDVTSRLGRGVLDLTELGSRGLNTIGIENPVKDWVEETRNNVDFFKPDIREALGGEGFVERGLKGIASGIAPSLGAFAPGAAAGAAIGTALMPVGGTAAGAVIGGLFSTLLTFGAGSYDKAKEDYLKINPDDLDGAHEYGLKIGAIEGGIEAAATGLEMTQVGRAASPLIRALKSYMKVPVKQLAKATVKNMGTEAATEMLQSGLSTDLSNKAGITDEGIVSSMAEAFIPAVGMSLFFSAGSHGYTAAQRNKVLGALNSEDPVLQLKAAKLIEKGIKESGTKEEREDAKKLADQWALLAESVISDPNGKFSIDANIVDQLNKELKKATGTSGYQAAGTPSDIKEQQLKGTARIAGGMPTVDLSEWTTEEDKLREYHESIMGVPHGTSRYTSPQVDQSQEWQELEEVWEEYSLKNLTTEEEDRAAEQKEAEETFLKESEAKQKELKKKAALQERNKQLDAEMALSGDIQLPEGLEALFARKLGALPLEDQEVLLTLKERQLANRVQADYENALVDFYNMSEKEIADRIEIAKATRTTKEEGGIAAQEGYDVLLNMFLKQEDLLANRNTLRRVVKGDFDNHPYFKGGMLSPRQLVGIKRQAQKMLDTGQGRLFPGAEESTGNDVLDMLLLGDNKQATDYINKYKNPRAVIEDIWNQIEDYTADKPDLALELNTIFRDIEQPFLTERKKLEGDYRWEADPESGGATVETSNPETGDSFIVTGSKGTGYQLYKTTDGFEKLGKDTYATQGAAQQALNDIVPATRTQTGKFKDNKWKDYTVEKRGSRYFLQKDGEQLGVGYRTKTAAMNDAFEMEGSSLVKSNKDKKEYIPVSPRTFEELQEKAAEGEQAVEVQKPETTTERYLRQTQELISLYEEKKDKGEVSVSLDDVSKELYGKDLQAFLDEFEGKVQEVPGVESTLASLINQEAERLKDTGVKAKRTFIHSSQPGLSHVAVSSDGQYGLIKVSNKKFRIVDINGIVIAQPESIEQANEMLQDLSVPEDIKSMLNASLAESKAQQDLLAIENTLGDNYTDIAAKSPAKADEWFKLKQESKKFPENFKGYYDSKQKQDKAAKARAEEELRKLREEQAIDAAIEEGNVAPTMVGEEETGEGIEELDFNDYSPLEFYSTLDKPTGVTTEEEARTILNNYFGKKVIDNLIDSGKLQLHRISTNTDLDERIGGRYLTDSDTVEIYTDRINKRDLVRVFLHEMSHSANVQESLFGKGTDEFLSAFLEKRHTNADIMAAYRQTLAAAKKLGREYTQSEIQHETLAYFLQNADLSKNYNKRWYNKVMSFFRRVMVKLFGAKAARTFSNESIVDFYIDAIKTGKLDKREVGQAGVDKASVYNTATLDKAALIQEVRDLSSEGKNITSEASSKLEEVSNFAKSIVQSTSDALNNISTDLGTAVSKFEYDSAIKVKERTDLARPFLDSLKEMDNADKAELHLTLANGWENERDNVLGRYPKAKEAFNKMQAALDEIKDDADAVGILDKKIENYFPRRIKDIIGLINHKKEDGTFDLADTEVEQARQAAERNNQPFTKADEQAIIAQVLSSGQHRHIPRPGATKDRTATVLKPEYLQYYEALEDTILNHIYEMTENVEKRRLIGNSNRASILKRMVNKARAIEKATDAKDVDQEVIDQLREEWRDLNERLNNTEENIDESIAGMLVNLGVEDKDEVISLIRARIKERGPNKIVGTLRDLGYLFSIGQATSAITQIGDQAFNLYKNKKYALRGTGLALRALINKKGITQEDFDFAQSMKEYSNSPISKLVDTALKWSGLKAMDLFGKESFFQSTALRLQNQSLQEFKNEFGHLFGGDEELINKTHNDFKSGNKTGDTLFVLYNELSKYQPINLSQMPKSYLEGGNARAFYMLKTFNLRALNALYRDVATEVKSGNTKQGIKNLAMLSSLLVIAGASADEIKDFMSGKEEPFGDNVHDNLLKLLMTSRYTLESGLDKDKFITSMIQSNLPPVRYMDDFVTDLYALSSEDKDFKFKSLAQLPVIGRVAYNRSSNGQTSYLKRKKQNIYEDVREGASFSEVRRQVARYNKKARKYGESIITPSSLKKIRREAALKGR